MRRTRRQLTLDQVKDILSYDKWTGHLTWLNDSKDKRRAKKGEQAGRRSPCGYLMISVTIIKGVTYAIGAHRIAWLLHYKEFPSKDIDHINGVPWDNRICNLRLADPSQQNFNTTAQRHSSHGFKGLIFDPDKCKGGRWRARIQARGKRIHLGWFKTEGEAIEAYKKGMDLYHEGYAPDLTVRKQSFLLRPAPKTKEPA